MKNDITVGSVFTSLNFGDFEIVEYINFKKVKVRFIDTGFCVETRADQIRLGNVKDKLKPSVCGVGYVGDGEFKVSDGGKATKAYIHWRGMMQRCYKDSIHINQPTYKGCSVCDEWHNFQNFAKWFYSQERCGESGIQVDKDIVVDGNKVYSPDFCILVSSAENNAKSVAKDYVFLSPDGEVVEVNNLRDFCIKNNLSDAHMNSVHSGKRKSHKGWRALNAH